MKFELTKIDAGPSGPAEKLLGSKDAKFKPLFDKAPPATSKLTRKRRRTLKNMVRNMDFYRPYRYRHRNVTCRSIYRVERRRFDAGRVERRFDVDFLKK